MKYIPVTLCLLILPWVAKGQDESHLRIPEGLKIGVASSAYQIEGGWNASDKSMSNWDVFTNEQSHRIRDGSNGNVACDSYHRYKEDIQIIKSAGFKHYRFSLSWARILPSGFANKVSRDGIQYYKNVIDELLANGIEPVITLYHWDIPDVIQKMGGWLNDLMVDYFVEYARVVFRELGPKVKVWVTINEPNIDCVSAYDKTTHAPGLNMTGIGSYICSTNMLKAHARVYRMYHEEFAKTQKGKVGIVLHCIHMFPFDENEADSAETGFQHHCGWFGHPIFSKQGDYPATMKKKIQENSKLQGYPTSRLPVLSPYWIKYIRGTSDYFGLNHYTSKTTRRAPREDNAEWFQDSGVILDVDETWPLGASSWLRVVPEGFGEMLRKIKAEYNNPPVYVMENGFSGKGSDLDIVDATRIDYFYRYMKEMLLAINRDGCNVQVYTVWSILDNFEWSNGYTERFGIVHVNFTDGTRTPRRSVNWWNHVIRTKKLISFDEFEKEFL